MVPAVPSTSVLPRIRALTTRADEALRRLDLGLAHDLLDCAHVFGRTAHEDVAAAEALAQLGFVAHLRNDVGTARELYGRALVDIVDADVRSLVRTRIAFAYYDGGDLEAARGALTTLGDDVTPKMQARAKGYFGNIARAEGDFVAARKAYDEAMHALRALGDHDFVVTFAMDTAICSLLDGDAATALGDLRALRGSTALSTRPQLGALVAHYETLALIALRIPLGSLPANDAFSSALPLAAYLAEVRAAAAAPPTARSTFVELREKIPANAHARVSLAIVEGGRLRRMAPEPRALVVSRDGTHARLGERAPIVLTQRLALARIVSALAEARARTPGRFIERDELAALAWPNERMTAASRKNRFHVAMSTLRGLGLRQVVESFGSGYRVDPDVRAIIIE